MVEAEPRKAPFVEWIDTPTHTQEIFRNPEGQITQLNTLNTDLKFLHGNTYKYDDKGRLISRRETYLDSLYQYHYVDNGSGEVVIELRHFKDEAGEWKLNHPMIGTTGSVYVPRSRQDQVELVFKSDESGIVHVSPVVLDAWRIPYSANIEGDMISEVLPWEGNSQYVDEEGKFHDAYISGLIGAYPSPYAGIFSLTPTPHRLN